MASKTTKIAAPAPATVAPLEVLTGGKEGDNAPATEGQGQEAGGQEEGQPEGDPEPEASNEGQNAPVAPAENGPDHPVKTPEELLAEQITEIQEEIDCVEERYDAFTRIPARAMLETKILILREIGIKRIELDQTNKEIADLQNKIKELMAKSQEITPIVREAEVRLNQTEAALNSYRASAKLMPTVRGRKASTGATGENKEPSDRALNSALEIIRDLPAVFTAQDVMRVKDCGRNTAGGTINRWKEAGIVEWHGKEGSGEYKLAPKYVGM